MEFFEGWKPKSPLQLAMEEVMWCHPDSLSSGVFDSSLQLCLMSLLMSATLAPFQGEWGLNAKAVIPLPFLSKTGVPWLLVDPGGNFQDYMGMEVEESLVSDLLT
ncbi:hypothetical protein Tco_0831765 [Tanacetum coccineum]